MADLKAAYLSAEGDVETILVTVLCCTYADEPRFREILDGLIATGELPRMVAYAEESDAKKRARKKKVCACYFFCDDKAMGTRITLKSTRCSCP